MKLKTMLKEEKEKQGLLDYSDENNYHTGVRVYNLTTGLLCSGQIRFHIEALIEYSFPFFSICFVSCNLQDK